MKDDKLGENLEWAESRLIWLWQVGMGASFLYLFMFFSVFWNPQVRRVQKALQDLQVQMEASKLLDRYKDVYLEAGAVALEAKLQSINSLPNSSLPLDAECQTIIPANHERAVLQSVLRKCATWKHFSALLLDKDSVFRKQMEGGGYRIIYNVPSNWLRVDQDEKLISSLPGSTGLEKVAGWERNVLDAINTLAELHDRKKQELNLELARLKDAGATGRFDIPILEKSVNPVPVFWLGGFFFFLIGHYTYVTWKSRRAVIEELHRDSGETLTWENAITRYTVKLLWLVPNNQQVPRDRVSKKMAQSLLPLATASVVCITIYCAQFPSVTPAPVKYLVAFVNLTLGSIAMAFLFSTWKDLGSWFRE